MKRSKHSLSHYKLTTFDMGNLIPLTWFDTLPGDTVQQNTSMLIRVSPLLSPVMHPCQVRIHHWFVPLRLIWEDFEDFITGGPDGTSTPVVPFRAPTVTEGSIYDYLGIPPGTTGVNVSALPLRAYNLIWNEFYRDQDLGTLLTVETTSGADTSSSSVKNVCWEKDYFTTCRPWEQKGDDVYIPLYDQTIDVDPTGTPPTFTDGSNTDELSVGSAGAPSPVLFNKTTSGADLDWDDPQLTVDLTSVTGIPIEDLRLALGLQKYQEARAKYGSRYSEYLAYLGVKSSDARLQRPEYLGGGRQTIQFSEVLSTDGSNTGDMKGHGIAAMRTNRYRKFFEEHGIVMTLASVLPKSIYTQGIHRSLIKTTKEDFYQKELEFIGEQEVYNKEVYSTHSSPDDVFGYQARYDEYRYQPSGISGEFHSTNDHWHLARIFGSDPSLNQTFVGCVPTKRILASSSTDSLYVMANHSIQARRAINRVARTKTGI